MVIQGIIFAYALGTSNYSAPDLLGKWYLWSLTLCKSFLIESAAATVRTITLAVDLICVISAVVGPVADPGRVDAERRGVTADESLLFHPQFEEMCTAGVI